MENLNLIRFLESKFAHCDLIAFKYEKIISGYERTWTLTNE